MDGGNGVLDRNLVLQRLGRDVCLSSRACSGCNEKKWLCVKVGGFSAASASKTINYVTLQEGSKRRAHAISAAGWGCSGGTYAAVFPLVNEMLACSTTQHITHLSR